MDQDRFLNYWRPEESAILAKYKHDIDELQKRLKGRTLKAIRTRLRNEGYIKRTEIVVNPWFGSETKKLKEVWATDSKKELEALFPRHSFNGIKTQAQKMGLKDRPPVARYPKTYQTKDPSLRQIFDAMIQQDVSIHSLEFDGTIRKCALSKWRDKNQVMKIDAVASLLDALGYELNISPLP